MAIRPEIIQAISGGGLAAEDYAGLTPEQIAMVSGQGQKDRQIMLGTVMDMQQQELAERKQTQEEMHQNRMFSIMQRQEARAEFQAIHSQFMDRAQLGLQKQRLQLERMQTEASLQTHGMEQEKIGLQLNELKYQQDTLNKMKDRFVEIPGYQDADGNPLKMSIGEVHAIGALDRIIDAGLRKSAASGGSKVVELREYMADIAKQMGTSKHTIDMLKLMGPEALKGMNRQTIYALQSKNNAQFNMLSQEQKEALIERDLNLIDMLRIDVADQLSTDTPVGANTPGGTPPKATSAEDYLREEGY